jgi:hypothetical protein
MVTLGAVAPIRPDWRNGVTAQQLLTALFNAGIAISIGATVLSLGMTYTVGQLVAPLHRVVLVIVSAQLHGNPTYLGPAITFALVGLVLPIALAVEIGHRAATPEPAPIQPRRARRALNRTRRRRPCTALGLTYDQLGSSVARSVMMAGRH